MTLTELRYIVALAREHHFGRAADKCNVSQPTLSVAVKKLEEELGVALFERGSGDVRATPIGTQVVAQAERVLAEAARVARNRRCRQGPARRAAAPRRDLHHRPLAAAGAGAARQGAGAADAAVHRRGLYRKSAGTSSSPRELDVLVLALPVEEPGLVAQPVYEEAFRTLVPAAHPWAGTEVPAPRTTARRSRC